MVRVRKHIQDLRNERLPPRLLALEHASLQRAERCPARREIDFDNVRRGNKLCIKQEKRRPFDFQVPLSGQIKYENRRDWRAPRFGSFVIVEVTVLVELGILSSFWMVCNECEVHGHEEDCQEVEVKGELPKKSSKPDPN